MADQKISELTALTGANVADDDAIAIVDTSATETKKIVFSELKNALDTATGFVRITGDTMTGNLSMGDNVKAIFGAGSDLQIYHDGSNSYIKDLGTGNLIIDGTNLTIRDSNTAKVAISIQNNSNEPLVQLRYDNATKLATESGGVNITGTLTSDGLTVDGDANLSGTAVNFDLDETDTTDLNTRFRQSAGQLFIQTLNDAKSLGSNRVNINHTTGDISFYDSLGSSQSLFWDASAESLGIGTSSPSTNLHVSSPSNGATALVEAQGAYNARLRILSGNANSSFLEFADPDDSDVGEIVYEHSNNSMRFNTNASEAMRIDSSGNVGIGVTPEAWNSAFPSVLQIGAGMALTTSGGDNARILGNVYYDGSYKRITSGFAHQYEQTGGTHRWAYAATGAADSTISFSEAMRIDSSGNLLVGTTDSTVYNAGADLGLNFTSAGRIYTNSGSTHVLNLTSAAQLMQFRVGGTTTVGGITLTASATSFNTSSDHRLKENVADLTGATTRLKQLEPKRFNFIADADTTVDGFLAHEVQTVVPEAITGTHNEVDDEGNPVYQGIDQSKLVPLLVATIKELEARITALENA